MSKAFPMLKLRMVDSEISKKAAFILANYELIFSSFSPRELKLFFIRPVSLLGLGENHTRDDDRFLNAHTIQICSDKNTALFGEGNDNAADGPLKYLSHHSRAQARNWDNIDSEMSDFGDRYLKFTIETFRTAKAFLDLSFEEGYFQREQYLEFVKRFVDEKHHKDLCIEGNQPSQEVLQKIKHTTLNFLLTKLTAVNETFLQEFKMRNRKRNLSLLNNFQNIFRANKKGIFVAGSLHFEEPAVQKNLVALLKAYTKRYKGTTNIPALLFAKPLVTNTTASIKASFQKYLGNPVQQSEAMPAPEQARTSATPVDPLEMTKQTLRLGVEQTFNFNDNHFGFWLNLSLDYLIQEKNVLEKPLSPA